MLKKDVSFAQNRVPPPISLRLLLGVPPSLPLWGDIFYGWSLMDLIPLILTLVSWIMAQLLENYPFPILALHLPLNFVLQVLPRATRPLDAEVYFFLDLLTTSTAPLIQSTINEFGSKLFLILLFYISFPSTINKFGSKWCLILLFFNWYTVIQVQNSNFSI